MTSKFQELVYKTAMVYVMIDKDVHGKVTPENFCKLWPEDGGEIAKQVSAIIDDDGDGNLSFEEILAFRVFVEGITNEDGLLTKSDTKALITTLFVNEFNGENLMNEEIDEMVEQFGDFRDGEKLDYKAFVRPFLQEIRKRNRKKFEASLYIEM